MVKLFHARKDFFSSQPARHQQSLFNLTHRINFSISFKVKRGFPLPVRAPALCGPAHHELKSMGHRHPGGVERKAAPAVIQTVVESVVYIS